MSQDVNIGGDVTAHTINTGFIQNNINLTIDDIESALEQLAGLLALPGSRVALAPGGELSAAADDRPPLPLSSGLQEGFRLLPQAVDAPPKLRHRAYAAWLVTRQPQRPQQAVAARDYFIPLAGRITTEEELLRPYFTERRIVGEGPQRQIERHRLADVTEAVDKHPAFVLLGSPGSGKTTVLHRLALTTARDFLTGAGPRLPLLITLADYRWQQEPLPLDFVHRRWRSMVADDFVDLARSGHILLLADGLNEMLRLESSGQRRRRASAWERFMNDYFSESASQGSRAIIASRDQADYDQPLGLPRVEIDPLSDDQIADFLRSHLDSEAENALSAIKRLELLEQARTPYSLFILTQLYDPDSGDLPPNRGRLFARYAHHLLAGEQHVGHEWYEQDAALAALAELGYALQRRGESTVLPAAELQALLPPEVHLPGQRQAIKTPPELVFELACRARVIIPDPTAAAAEAHKFSHQLLQEQFAAQHLLTRWQAGDDLTDLWYTPRTHKEMPQADDVGEWDPLPLPPASGWEQATILAAGITPQADAFVQAVLAENPALAGRCLVEGAAPVSPATRSAALVALLADLSDPALHRRARLQAGQVLGAVGDPRFEPVTIGAVEVILPDLIEVPGGTATLGARRWPFDRQAFDRERPQHQVEVAPFYLARYPVTNAEYECFIKAGGYDVEDYWTPTGWRWRQGELEESGPIEQWLEDREFILANPNVPNKLFKEGRITPEYRDTLLAIAQMSEDELRQELSAHFTPQPHERPYFWDDSTYNGTNQPVVGVTWYEAMAYCAWLNERIGEGANGEFMNGEWRILGDRPDVVLWEQVKSKILNPKSKIEIRLPTEAEWEWAAGGPGHSRYPWGKKFDLDKANTLEGRVLKTSPVGAYPAGAATCGALDMSGNVYEWTHTLYRDYPYQLDNGREDTLTEGRRVLRGGSWYDDGRNARVSSRYGNHPDNVGSGSGFRLVVAPVFP